MAKIARTTESKEKQTVDLMKFRLEDMLKDFKHSNKKVPAEAQALVKKLIQDVSKTGNLSYSCMGIAWLCASICCYR